MVKKKEIEEEVVPQNESEVKEKAIQLAIDSIEKMFGKGSVKYGDGNGKRLEYYPTGLISFDKIAGGGFVKGHISEVFGLEGCLAEETFVPFKILSLKTNKIINSKGGSIKLLYERFHNNNETGIKQGKHLRNNEVYFGISSINKEDCIFTNLIADVVKTGTKECYLLKTKSGKEIKCTKDHKFYIGNNNYKTLDSLSSGDSIFISNKTTNKKDKKIRTDYLEKMIKYHPSQRWHTVNATNKEKNMRYKYQRCRVKFSHLVFEAMMNKISYEEYVSSLETSPKEECDKFWTVPEEYDIHHLDENKKNDDISNLKLIEKKEHYRIHALENHNNLRFKVVKDEIISIENIGLKETYDIKCFDPYNNYVANGIVVHNCGKSSLILNTISHLQRLGKKCAIVDTEHELNFRYATSLGVDMNQIIYTQPITAEEAGDIIDLLVKSGAVDFIALDSVACLVSAAELEGSMSDQQMGAQARIIGKMLRKIKGNLSKTNTHLCCINQIRQKMVSYGSPNVSPGGLALKFFASQRFEITKIGQKKQGEQIIGNNIKIKCIKNKDCDPFQESELSLIFGQGFDPYYDILEMADANKLLSKSGAWYNYGDIKLGCGETKAVEFLKQNQEVYEKLRAEILKLFNPA